MREDIIKALDIVYNKFLNIIPNEKTEIKSISIIDVSPIKLHDFIKKNNIPDNCVFNGRDNGYDSWDDILLEWAIKVPMTDKDRKQYCIDKFDIYAYVNIGKYLSENGYIRKPFRGNKNILKGKSLYKQYINNDIDIIIDYFSEYYEKDSK